MNICLTRCRNSWFNIFLLLLLCSPIYRGCSTTVQPNEGVLFLFLYYTAFKLRPLLMNIHLWIIHCWCCCIRINISNIHMIDLNVGYCLCRMKMIFKWIKKKNKLLDFQTFISHFAYYCVIHWKTKSEVDTNTKMLSKRDNKKILLISLKGPVLIWEPISSQPKN